MKKYIWLLFVCALSSSAYAGTQDIKVVLTMPKLALVKMSEKGGDELYLSLTEFSSKIRPYNYLIPDFPMHWLSRNVGTLKNIVLWDRVVAEGESVSLLVSLIEQDIEPWNLDDLIGTIKLKVRNNKGVLTKEWLLPNNPTFKSTKSAIGFDLKGGGGDYKVFLQLDESLSKNKLP